VTASSTSSSSGSSSTKAPAVPTAKKTTLAKFLPLIERVAKAEYRRIPTHMIDVDELVNIGAIAIQALIQGKTDEALAKLNTSYLATATRWAIRNELRTRYKWYTLKHNKVEEEDKTEGGDGNPTPNDTVREAIYETILSIDGITDGGPDNDHAYEFIKDQSATPEEHLEVVELGRAIRRAIDRLPEKERVIMEYRFYRNLQVKDIATKVGLSSSRITRIVQASLNTVRDTLRKEHQID
jgi:RNA polymerase sigma factor (sigma-70 family)